MLISQFVNSRRGHSQEGGRLRPERARRCIWRAPGERWFSNADPIVRVHGAPTMYIGGIRALLLQSLHPLAMAGVAGHSGYQDDPWGRLQRTAEYVVTTTFARKVDVEKMIEHVRRFHSYVMSSPTAVLTRLPTPPSNLGSLRGRVVLPPTKASPTLDAHRMRHVVAQTAISAKMLHESSQTGRALQDDGRLRPRTRVLPSHRRRHDPIDNPLPPPDES